jgi:hypothetical protein
VVSAVLCGRVAVDNVQSYSMTHRTHRNYARDLAKPYAGGRPKELIFQYWLSKEKKKRINVLFSGIQLLAHRPIREAVLMK